MTFFCQTKREFGEEFATAARRYAETAVTLVLAGTSRDEFARLCEITKEAQNRSEAAFIALQQHVDSHQCYEASRGSAVPG